MKVRDVMTRGVITIGPDTLFKDIVHRYLVHDISGLPVLDDGHLVGLVSETDLVTKEAFGLEEHERDRHGSLHILAKLLGADDEWRTKGQALTARELMTSEVETAEPDEDLRIAARRMIERQVTRLPIVEGDKLVGILSRRDILRVFHRSDEDIAADISGRLKDPFYTPPDSNVTCFVTRGTAVLGGSVLYAGAREAVENMVWDVPGVVNVQSEITFREPGPEIPLGDVDRSAFQQESLLEDRER